VSELAECDLDVVSEVPDTSGTDRYWNKGGADRLEPRCSDDVNSLVLSWKWRSKPPEAHWEGTYMKLCYC